MNNHSHHDLERALADPITATTAPDAKQQIQTEINARARESQHAANTTIWRYGMSAAKRIAKEIQTLAAKHDGRPDTDTAIRASLLEAIHEAREGVAEAKKRRDYRTARDRQQKADRWETALRQPTNEATRATGEGVHATDNR
jgi:hypothetical protein